MYNLNLEILISAMYQTDLSIINKSRIFSNTVIINQCNEEKYTEDIINNKKIRMFYTEDRGLSNSRNKAIKEAKGDICLICDDDEIFVNGYEEKILNGFNKYNDADVIVFKMKNIENKIKGKKINYLNALRVGSWQIAFKRKSIIDNNILFDTKLGSGTDNGPGEENKFLYDCLKKGLNIYYIPEEIAEVNHTESQWFDGFNKNYFIKRGISTRRIMGIVPSILYAVYFVITKHKLYKENISAISAFSNIFKGLLMKV